MEGLIKYKCIATDGREYTAQPLNISLELKPLIKSITDFVEYPTSEYNYQLGFTVSYVGADYLTVSVIEEDCSAVRTRWVYEPILAHVVSPEICSLFNTWIEVKATNEYGATTATIERLANLPPTQSQNSTDSIEDLEVDTQDTSLCQIEIYNVSGQFIGRGEDQESLKQSLRPGLYIIRHYYEGGRTTVEKYIKR
ncbi:MAG: T9SS type A sorting domain-containing protein [Bacteroidales bacterium]|nr:T9SS type A sorting domain-containing protein [Bacteroidales bacterium]